MPIPPVTKRLPSWTAGVSRLEVLACLGLVGVLMAVLLPRLAALNDAARPVRLQTAVGTVRAAASAFHARCEAVRSGEANADCARLLIDGQPVAGVLGWPAASVDGIARVAALPVSPPQQLDAFRVRPGVRHGTPALFFGLGDQSCEFVYVQAQSLDGVPEVDIVDASCQ